MSVNGYKNRIRPFFYDMANEIESLFQPSTLRSTNTLDYHYFFKYLMQEIYTLFEFDGLPEQWNKQFFIWGILYRGWLAIVNAQPYGWIPQPCVWGAGRNVFGFPTSVLVSNGWFNPSDGQNEYFLNNDVSKKIVQNAYIVNTSPDYTSPADIAGFYAVRMATLFSTIDNSAVMSRNGFILTADSKADSMTIEKAVQSVLNGELIVTIKAKAGQNKDINQLVNLYETDVEKHYIVDKVLVDLQNLLDMFHNDIGFPSVKGTDYRYRNKDELAFQNSSITIKSDLWYECLEESIKKFNDATGHNIKVKKRFASPDTLINDKQEVNRDVSIDSAV